MASSTLMSDERRKRLFPEDFEEENVQVSSTLMSDERRKRLFPDEEVSEPPSLDKQVNSAMGVEEEEEEPEEKTKTEKLIEAYTPPVIESGDAGKYVDDLKRIGFRNARNLTEFLVDSVVSTNNFYANEKNQINTGNASREQKTKALNSLTANIISNVVTPSWKEEDKTKTAKSITEDPSLIDENGRIKTTETVAGVVTDIGVFMAGGWRMSKGLGGGTVANIIGYETASQLFMPYEENLFNVIQEATLTEENKNLHGQIVLDMLATSPEDTGNERRAKLLVEGLGFGLAVKAVTSLPAAFRYLKNGKSVDDMTEEELEAALETYTREAKAANREAAGPKTVDNAVRGTDSEAGVAQIERQSTNNLKREAAEEAKKNVFGDVAAWMTKAKQQYFASRGYATPLLYEAALNAKFAQRQAISRAGHIGKRLDKAFKSAGGDPRLLEKINELLAADLSSAFRVKPERRVAFFARQRNIPEEVASEILEARTLIDELSEKILKTNGFDAAGKEAVKENLKTYLRRSYRAFEDPNYIPTTASREKAIKFLADTEYNKQVAKEVEKLGGPVPEKRLEGFRTRAISKAESDVKEMLTMPAAGVDYVNQVQRVNQIFKKNEDLSPEIRELLGEIKAPSENILLSISKASRMVEMQTMYNRMHELGQNKYFFNKTVARDKANKKAGADIYTEKITGTNSVLDGQYTTREIGKFLRNEEEKIFLPESDNPVAAGYRYYIGAKGFAQAMKTTYSHVTHARNVIGGYQFGLANGRLLSHADPRTLQKLTGLLGDRKVLNAQYEEYLGLGVINTSVSVNQFRDMLETGFKGRMPLSGVADTIGRTETGTRIRQTVADSEGLQRLTGVIGDSFVGKTAKGLTNAVVEKPGQVYMGADDFFKIGAFEAELATLKKAFPNASESVLKQEAAKIVKNTMPNYDQIPKGIKALRNLPLGNFVAFPAEIVRTSVHIVKQSAKELSSSSNIIRRRGAQRLTGFAFTNVGFGVIADQSADLLQFTEQEVADRNLLGSGPFSSGRDTIFTRDENGDVYALDTQYLNSYNTISAPIREAYDRIITGELKGQEFEDYLGEAVKAAVVEFTTPYISTSIASGPIASLAQGFMNEDGRDAEGRVIFTQKDGLNIENMKKSLARSFVPGSLISLGKLNDTGALGGIPGFSKEAKPNEYTMQYRDEDAELVAQVGVNWQRKNSEDLKRGFKDLINSYNIIEGRNSKDKIKFSSMDDAVQDYMNVNTARFQNQQDLYLAAQAADRLFGRRGALKILTDNGFTKNASEYLIAGDFLPESTTKIDNILEVTRSEYLALRTKKEKDIYLSKIIKTQQLVQGMEAQLKRLPLDNAQAFDTDKELESVLARTGRTKKSTGGEVSELIPNAPSEPDERINKVTGLPYNEGAGAAYMDTDDPMRVLKMNKGGSVDRQGYKLGGLWKEIKDLQGRRDRGSEDVVAFQTPVIVTTEPPRVRMNLGGVVPELSTSDPMGVKASNRESAKVVADVVTDTLPVVGEVKGAIDTVKSIREGDYTGAAVNAGATLLGIVPGVGDAAGRVLKTKRKKLETLINKLKTSLSERTEVDTPIRPVPPRQLDEANKDYDERVSLALKTQGVDVSEKLKTGGEYVDPRTNKPLTNRVVSNSVIAPFTQERPVFQGVLQDYSSNTKMLESVRKEAVKKNSDITILKSNLLKNNKYKIVSEDIEGLQDHTDRFGIVTVVGKNTLKYKKDRGMESDHMYGLQVEVKGDAVLERKVTKDKNNKYGYAQPSLKPHFVGDMKQGNKVGEIKMQGKIHPLYDVIRVDAESLSSKTTKAQGGAIKTQLIVFDAELLAEE
jgi:hypothetical protein